MPAKFRHAFKLREFVYPSNLLTIARLLMLPAALRSMRQPGDRWRALGALGIAMLTDALDGPMARWRQEVSPLGKVLDPIADKIMIDATALMLARTRGFPWWVAGGLVARDLAIVLGSMLVYRRRAEISVAHPSGKATTAALTIATLLYIIDGPRLGRPALYAALVPFTISLAIYIRQFWRAMRDGHEAEDHGSSRRS
jgi:CDP-diacylglycerol--glycerol-3-phosphate 3-phosphatidyltransferase